MDCYRTQKMVYIPWVAQMSVQFLDWLLGVKGRKALSSYNNSISVFGFGLVRAEHHHTSHGDKQPQFPADLKAVAGVTAPPSVSFQYNNSAVKKSTYGIHPSIHPSIFCPYFFPTLAHRSWSLPQLSRGERQRTP